MAIHLTSCRSIDLRATDSEMRELARVLERGRGGRMGQRYKLFRVIEGDSEALICAEALRRVAG